MSSVGERTGISSTEQAEGYAAKTKDQTKKRSGMQVPRVFSTEGVSPFDQVEWDLRTAEIKDERGRVIFQQTDCEIPKVVEPARHERRGRASTSTARSNTPGARDRASASWSTASPGRSPTGAARTATSPPTPTPSGSTTS